MFVNSYKGKNIEVLRNGDIFSLPKKVVISGKVYRNYEQFLHSLSASVKLNSGAVRKLYTLGGSPIHGLDSLEDGGMYVASSGDKFKRVPYRLDQNEPIVNGPTLERGRPTTRFRRGESVLSTGPTCDFDAHTKALRIVIFRNGGFQDPVGRLLINHKSCKNFSQILSMMSEAIKCQNGQVRKIHDASTGLRITSFKEMHDGQNLVGIGYEPFKQGHYNLVKLETNAQEKKPESSPRKVVTLYPNGDSFHNGWTVSVKNNRFPTLKKLIDHLNKQITLVTGLIGQLFTIEGHRIMNIQDLEQGASYVLVSSGDPFVYTDYNVNNIQVTTPFSKGLAGSTQKNSLMSLIRRPYQPLYDPEAKFRPKSRKTTLSYSRSPSRSTSVSKAEAAAAARPRSKSETVRSKHIQDFYDQSIYNVQQSLLHKNSLMKNPSTKSVIEEEEVVRQTAYERDDNDQFESPILQVFANKVGNDSSMIVTQAPILAKPPAVKHKAHSSSQLTNAKSDSEATEQPPTKSNKKSVVLDDTLMIRAISENILTEEETNEIPKTMSSNKPLHASESDTASKFNEDSSRRQSVSKSNSKLPSTSFSESTSVNKQVWAPAGPRSSKMNIASNSGTPSLSRQTSKDILYKKPNSRAGSEVKISESADNRQLDSNGPHSSSKKFADIVPLRKRSSGTQIKSGATTPKANSGANTPKITSGANTPKVMSGANSPKIMSGANTPRANSGSRTPSEQIVSSPLESKNVSRIQSRVSSLVQELNQDDVPSADESRQSTPAQSKPVSRVQSEIKPLNKQSRPQSPASVVSVQQFTAQNQLEKSFSRPTSANSRSSKSQSIKKSTDNVKSLDQLKSKSSVQLASNPMSLNNSLNHLPELPVNDEDL